MTLITGRTSFRIRTGAKPSLASIRLRACIAITARVRIIVRIDTSGGGDTRIICADFVIITTEWSPCRACASFTDITRCTSVIIITCRCIVSMNTSTGRIARIGRTDIAVVAVDRRIMPARPVKTQVCGALIHIGCAGGAICLSGIIHTALYRITRIRCAFFVIIAGNGCANARAQSIALVCRTGASIITGRSCRLFGMCAGAVGTDVAGALIPIV